MRDESRFLFILHTSAFILAFARVAQLEEAADLRSVPTRRDSNLSARTMGMNAKWKAD